LVNQPPANSTRVKIQVSVSAIQSAFVGWWLERHLEEEWLMLDGGVEDGAKAGRCKPVMFQVASTPLRVRFFTRYMA